jgi:hypothetical protein
MLPPQQLLCLLNLFLARTQIFFFFPLILHPRRQAATPKSLWLQKCAISPQLGLLEHVLIQKKTTILKVLMKPVLYSVRFIVNLSQGTFLRQRILDTNSIILNDSILVL